MKKTILLILLFISINIIYSPAIPEWVHKRDKKIESDLFERLWQGILETESNHTHFKNWKIVSSSAGAIGEAEVMSNTFLDIVRWSKTNLKIRHLHIRKYNLWAGKWYFSNSFYYWHRPNRNKAVSAYNMGKDNKKMNWDYATKVWKSSIKYQK